MSKITPEQIRIAMLSSQLMCEAHDALNALTQR